jgi:hypothetical protein
MPGLGARGCVMPRSWRTIGELGAAHAPSMRNLPNGQLCAVAPDVGVSLAAEAGGDSVAVSETSARRVAKNRERRLRVDARNDIGFPPSASKTIRPLGG